METMNEACPILEMKELTKIYDGGKVGCADITLDIAPGEIVAFIGANGAGKTTTLKAIAGVHKITSGDAFIMGHSITTETIAAKMEMAYLPDNPTLFEDLTASAYLEFISHVYDVPFAVFKEKTEHYASLFHLSDHLGEVLKTFSHGMKQKVALIGALIHSPRLLLLDEPFVGLDPEATHEVKEELATLCAAGSAVFYSTHVLDVAEKLAHRVAIIRDGRIIKSGTMEEIKGDESLEDAFLELNDEKRA